MTNAYDSTRGNVTDRQRRREWLLKTYRADVDMHLYPIASRNLIGCPLGEGVPACRCYRCGVLLTLETLTVDRIVPGSVKTSRYPKGGTYCRENIRPSCSDCANKQGGELSAEIRSSVPVVRPRVRGVAARNTPAGGDGARAVSVPDVPASGEGDLRRNGPLEGGA